MSDDNEVFVFAGVYDTVDDAEADYDVVKDLHSSGIVGSYDAAVITRDANGKVHVRKHEKPTQHGAWSGLAVGAVVGVVFPPSIIASGVVGAVAGGLIGHFARGMSRGDMDELGTMLDDGEAALVVVGKDRLDEVLRAELKRAAKTYEKQVTTDTRELRKELDKAIDESASSAV
jgi:uncharacterized membrane protein